MSLVNEVNGVSYSEQNLEYAREYGAFIIAGNEESLGNQLIGKPIKNDSFCYMSIVESKRTLILQAKVAELIVLLYWGKS